MYIKNNLTKILLSILYPALLFSSAHFGNRNDLSIVLVISILLPMYFYFLADIVSIFGNGFYFFFVYTIILRLIMIGSSPVWSDDVYRYLFDAKLFLEGISPYHYTPEQLTEFVQTTPLGLGFLLTNMNSPGYYSVYPLLLQCFFSLGIIIGSVFQNSFVGVQILIVLFDILNLLLIRKLYPSLSNKSYWLYFGNPIVILEGISQMHPEILLVTGSLFLFLSRSHFLKMGSFFLLTQLKFNTFLFVLGIGWSRRTWIKVLSITILSLFVWKVTVFSDLVLQGSAGLGLFFHSFRFAGILEPIFYFVLNPFHGEYLSGILSFVAVSFLYVFYFRKKISEELSLPIRFLIIYSLFLLFSPVIHPWYWILWVLFVMEIGKVESAVAAVSFLAFLSYGLYVDSDFVYIHWLVSILVLGFYGYKQINYLRKTT
ncbi:hypothetical protein EHQ68_07935 [Leptospira congkakensis]|uniref:DUF2029 domain-containing protein n=1 Tax=Leptospira congkakensis TaxID=2484932 RepID=A0A4Z1A3U8_9LEPT|nr:hypothetical protein [Leptospira congkakensis]TGL88563.1 hypothetical protein EHQ69_14005 [Leptospira congkakensis]TGL89149.1 hypothetical protein EHQ68_07935 [Leptospira congkakensis]TGL97115.1 hypothetical protein EHQ70_07430 [Leptospira congkakensis]